MTNEQTALDVARLKLSDAEYCAEWMTFVGKRFSVGDRVVFSKWAYRNGLHLGRRKSSRGGIVVSISEKQTIEVLMDGNKRPSKYHHMFFISSRDAGN